MKAKVLALAICGLTLAVSLEAWYSLGTVSSSVLSAVAVLDSYRGDVFFRTPETVLWERVVAGQAFSAGAVVSTDKGSTATLRFEGGDVVLLGEQSQLVLGRDDGHESDQFLVTIVKGQVRLVPDATPGAAGSARRRQQRVGTKRVMLVDGGHRQGSRDDRGNARTDDGSSIPVMAAPASATVGDVGGTQDVTAIVAPASATTGDVERTQDATAVPVAATSAPTLRTFLNLEPNRSVALADLQGLWVERGFDKPSELPLVLAKLDAPVTLHVAIDGDVQTTALPKSNKPRKVTIKIPAVEKTAMVLRWGVGPPLAGGTSPESEPILDHELTLQTLKRDGGATIRLGPLRRPLSKGRQQVTGELRVAKRSESLVLWVPSSRDVVALSPLLQAVESFSVESQSSAPVDGTHWVRAGAIIATGHFLADGRDQDALVRAVGKLWRVSYAFDGPIDAWQGRLSRAVLRSALTAAQPGDLWRVLRQGRLIDLDPKLLAKYPRSLDMVARRSEAVFFKPVTLRSPP